MKSSKDLNGKFFLIILVLFVFSSLLFAADVEKGADAGIEQIDLFVSGQGGYDTYRIPSIVVTTKGTVLAFCEGRKNSKGDAGDIDLLVRRSVDDGKNWSKTTVLWNDKGNTCGNPCAVVDEITGDIFLLSTWNLGSDHEREILKNESKDSRRVFVIKSEDDGVTWSKPNEITESTKAKHWRWYATGPGSGIQLKYGAKKGRLVIPADHSFFEFAPDVKYGAHVIYSDDHGKTWSYSDAIMPGLNENEVVEMLDGKIMMNARNHRYRGSRGIAFSMDCGETWPYVSYQSNLQEPRCQASVARYSPNRFCSKDIVLFSNPNHDKKRVNMSVKLSYDQAKTWPIVKSLYAGPSAYSCLAVLADGKIACFYEAGRKSSYEKIVLSIFTIDWLTDGKEKVN